MLVPNLQLYTAAKCLQGQSLLQGQQRVFDRDSREHEGRMLRSLDTGCFAPVGPTATLNLQALCLSTGFSSL